MELTITSRNVGLLRRACEYGPNVEIITIKGTGEAELYFKLFDDTCPPEINSFQLSQGEVEGMIGQLLGNDYPQLDSEYSGQRSARVERSSVPSLVVAVTISPHAPDVEVALKLGEFHHSVRYHNGAHVPGLSNLVKEWLPALRQKAELPEYSPREDS